MKKIFLFVLIVCMCVALGACTATDPDNLFESVPEDTENTFPEDFVYYTGAYQYGNMQSGSSPRFMLIDNEVVFGHYHYNESESLMFSRVVSYDLKTGEARSFCKDATCTHEECAASPLWTDLEVYQGKLYGTTTSWHIVRANEKGADIIVDTMVYDFCHYDNKLYFKTADASLMMLEEGTKEPQMVIDEYTGNDQVVFGDYLYAKRNDIDFIRVDLTAEKPKEELILESVYAKTDGQHIYYVDWETYQFYRCDMGGKNAELLVEQPVFFVSFNFDDEYVYYRLYTDLQQTGHPDSRDVYRFPKADPTQVVKIATLPRSIGQIYTVPGTDKIFVDTYYEPGDKEVVYFIMGTDGSNPTKLEIPEY